jgi:hypothetical protein
MTCPTPPIQTRAPTGAFHERMIAFTGRPSEGAIQDTRA